jgi:Fibronectin type III domain
MGTEWPHAVISARTRAVARARPEWMGRDNARVAQTACAVAELLRTILLGLPPMDSREERSPINLRTAVSFVCSALVLLVGVQVVSAAPAPGVSWATKAGGTGNDGGNGISALPDGSSIVTGYFEGATTFDSTTLTGSAGIADVFTAKMNADGTWAWATKAGGSGFDVGNGVSALPDGSSIVTGGFEGAATFDSTTLTDGAGIADVFVAKMNADGSWAWATNAGGSGSDSGQDISALPDGSSIVTGYFEGAATFDSTTLISSSAGIWDVFVAKMNADGSWAWATNAGGAGYDLGNGVSALPDGSSIVTGFFNGTATFGSTTLTSSSAGIDDVFVAKVNANGTWAWAANVGGRTNDSGNGVSALPDGSSIVTGHFEGAAAFGSTTLTSGEGGTDVFTAKMNADGTWAWAAQAGGSGYDVGNGVSALPDGSSIVTGGFYGTATFGSTTLTSRSAGIADVFVAKVNANGTWAWATKAGGSGVDSGHGVSALPDGSPIVTGVFSDTATFESTTLTSSSAGISDVFTARYLDAPQAPAAPVAVAGSASAAVTITPLAGGSVTSYTVISDPGEKTCTVVAPATICTVEGLTNGTSYRFRATATNTSGTGAASEWSNAVTPAETAAKKVPLLRSSLTCRKTGVRTTCTTRGPVPPGATAVTQRATTSAARASQSSEMARPTVKTAKAACRITKRGKGKKATRTYQCTIRLSKGKWTITTKALKKTTVIAQSVKTKKVK